MNDLLHDFRFALRALRRGGVTTLIALITLTVGLVGATALFSVIRAVLGAPLPADEPDLVLAIARTTNDSDWGPVPIPTFFDWQDRSRVFEHLGGWVTLSFNLSGPPPERLQAAAVSGGFFPSLGVQPLAGAGFGAEADTPGSERTVVISHGLWQRRFGGDQGTVGKAIQLDGVPWTVAAVMPKSFAYPNPKIDLWVPLGAVHEQLDWDNRAMAVLYAVARIAPGTDLELVRSDLLRVTETIAEDTGVADQPLPVAVGLEDQILGDLRSSLWLLLGAVLFVLLISCANVANLLVARGLARREEIAVRVALGSGRWRIVRLMLVESMTLAGLGTILALALTRPAARLVMAWIPAQNLPAEPVGLSPAIFVFGALLALGTGLVFGLVPALRFSRMRPADAMRQGQRAVAAGQRFQSALVVAEVAVAAVLLVGAGLMLRSLDSLLRFDAGFEPDGVLAQWVDPNPVRYTDIDSWARLYEQVLERSRALPGVERSALSMTEPLASGGQNSGRVAKPGLALRPDVLPMGETMVVSPGYFDALDIGLRSGRDFTADDRDDAPRVAIIDQALADHFFPGEDPIGRRVAFEFEFPPGGYRAGVQVTALWREVIGVVDSVHVTSLRQAPLFQIYAPYSQLPGHFRTPLPGMALLARTTGDPAAATQPLRTLVEEIDPTLPVYGVRTLEEVVAEHLAQERLLSALLGVLGLLALVLAGAGVYAALAHLVARRTREMGVRMALGADPSRLLRQVVWRGVRLALWGAVLGLAASTVLSKLVESRLYGVGRLDPLTLGAMAALLLAVATVACLLPAWRASRVDPQACLRYE